MIAILVLLFHALIITIKKAKIWYSVDSNCHRRCLIQHKSRKIGGFFKVNCGAMDGDLRRLKKILEAKWLIYVILKGIGKVSNRFYKFSFLMLIGWGRYEWKKMATQCPSRKLQIITFNIQPKHSYVNSMHI